MQTIADHIVARTVYGEARGQGYRGMVAVANVIMNRASKPGWWGTTPDGVCLRAWQFSCWNRRDPNRAKIMAVDASDAIFAKCLEIEREALAGTLTDITDGATHYFAPKSCDTLPKWAIGATFCGQIGDHRFYKMHSAAQAMAMARAASA